MERLEVPTFGSPNCILVVAFVHPSAWASMGMWNDLRRQVWNFSKESPKLTDDLGPLPRYFWLDRGNGESSMETKSMRYWPFKSDLRRCGEKLRKLSRQFLLRWMIILIILTNPAHWEGSWYRDDELFGSACWFVARKTWSENRSKMIKARAVEASWKIWDPGPKKQAFLFPAVLDGEICLQTSVNGCHLMLETMLFLIQKRRTKPAAFWTVTPTFQFPWHKGEKPWKNHSHFPISRGTRDQFRWPRRHCKLPRNLALHIEDFLPPVEIRRNKHGRFLDLCWWS